MNAWLDFDDTYIYDWYLWDKKVDPKFKVKKSKVKVKYSIIPYNYFGYKSRTDDWIKMIIIFMINSNKKLCPVALESGSRVQESRNTTL